MVYFFKNADITYYRNCIKIIKIFNEQTRIDQLYIKMFCVRNICTSNNYAYLLINAIHNSREYR